MDVTKPPNTVIIGFDPSPMPEIYTRSLQFYTYYGTTVDGCEILHDQSRMILPSIIWCRISQTSTVLGQLRSGRERLPYRKPQLYELRASNLSEMRNSVNLQILIDSYRQFQVLIDTYRYLQILLDTYRYLQILIIDTYRYLQIPIGTSRYLQYLQVFVVLSSSTF